MRGYEEDEDKRKNQRADRPLAVVQFQSQIRQRQQPAKQRHRPIQIVVGNSVRPESARALKQRKIVGHQPGSQQQRTQTPGECFPGFQESQIEHEAQRIGDDSRIEQRVVHSDTPGAWRAHKSTGLSLARRQAPPLV